MSSNFTDSQIKYIYDNITPTTNTCDLLDSFMKKFPNVKREGRTRKSVRDKINYVRSQKHLGKTPPTHTRNIVVGKKSMTKYLELRSFTPEQIEVLSRDVPEFETVATFKQQFPDERLPSLQTFCVWIHCAKYRKSVLDANKKIEAEEKKISQAKVNNTVLVPKTITHVYDKVQKPTVFADEGELLIKILNSNIEMTHMMSDILSELRNQTAISNKMLSEFTTAKEINQKKLDLVREMK